MEIYAKAKELAAQNDYYKPMAEMKYRGNILFQQIARFILSLESTSFDKELIDFRPTYTNKKPG